MHHLDHDGQGQSEVQRRLAAGLPAPTVMSKVARAGERIKTVDEAMGKTVHEARENLNEITLGLEDACRDMFRDLDKIVKKN